MPLNENISRHLRENLSKGAGGGLHLKSANARLIDAPILVIGLGGTGAEALIRIKHMVNERLNANSDMEKPDNIEYLAIDTDTRTEKNVHYYGTSFSKANSELCIMEDSNLEATYENLFISNQMPHVSEWISENIDVSMINHGAGGIRQIGRFLFFKKYETVKGDLLRKIAKITHGIETSEKKVYVFILTGISGGTGSGLFIDVPYIVRKLMDDMGCNAQILGFVFMPDVNMQDLAIDDYFQRHTYKRNGFAALKELDYLMNLGKHGNGETFEQNYGGNDEVSYDRAPYDICHLVSSINKKGVNNYSKEKCMLVTAETIINIIADEPDIGNNKNNYSISQYFANIIANTDAFVSRLKTRQPINYKYNVIGSSSGVLAMDDVLNYLTQLLFKEMRVMYDRIPTPQEVNMVITQLKIDREYIEESIVKTNVELPNVSMIGYDNLKSDPLLIENTYKDEISDVLKSVMDKNVEHFIKDFQAEANQEFYNMFINLDKGPYFASRIISSTNSFCLMKYINDLRYGELVIEKTNKAQLKQLKSLVTSTRSKLETSKPIMGYNKDALVKAHKKACLDYYSALLRDEILDKVSKCYVYIYNYVNSINDRLFNVFTELLNTLKNIFIEYADIANETSEEKIGNQTVFSWNIIDPSKLVTEVELMINSDPNFQIDMKKIVEEFIKELINHSSEWLDETKPKVAAKLNDFIVRSFSEITNKSIDFYIERIEGGSGRLEASITKLIQNLSKKAEVMFPLGVFGDSFRTPLYNYFSVPCNTDKFDRQLGDVSTVKKSIITNRIFMLNVNLAYPLMAYRDLEDYEQAYSSFIGKTAVGMHLYEKSGKNWANLPSPIYDRVWSAGYSNPVQKEYNDRLRDIFDKACEYGYIKEVVDDKLRKIACYYSRNLTDINSILTRFNVRDLDSSVPRDTANKVKGELLHTLDGIQGSLICKYLYDIKLDEHTNEADTDYSKGLFIHMPELNKKVTKMVEWHESILEAISKLDEKIKGSASYAKFAAVLCTGLISRRRGDYKYEDSQQFQRILYSLDASCLDTYYEYYVFNAYNTLDARERDFLYNRASNLLKESSDEVLDDYIKLMNGYFKDFSEKREKLSSEYNAVEEGMEKANFYAEMRNDIKKTLLDIYT